MKPILITIILLLATVIVACNFTGCAAFNGMPGTALTDIQKAQAEVDSARTLLIVAEIGLDVAGVDAEEIAALDRLATSHIDEAQAAVSAGKTVDVAARLRLFRQDLQAIRDLKRKKLAVAE